MKTISILKKLITFYFYLCLIGFLILFLGLSFRFFSGRPNLFFQDEPITLNFMDNFDLGTLSPGYFMITIAIGAYIGFQFIKALYLFKKSLNDLSQGKYFTELVTTNFKKIGKAFLICGFSFWGFKIILRIALLNDIKLGIDNTLVLLSILGLFFLFLSEAFSKARETKQENDLTI